MAGKEKKREGRARLGKTIKDVDPRRYAAIVTDLKSGKSLAAIQRDNRAGSESVSRIKNELLDGGELTNWKRRTAGKAAALAERMIDKMADELDTMKAGSLPIAAAVLIDKSTQLAGEPLQLITVRHELGQTFGGWLGNAAQMPATSRTIAANVVEIGENPPERACLGKSGDGKQDGGDAEEGGGDEKSQPPSV